jgi:hypothetical protein
VYGVWSLCMVCEVCVCCVKSVYGVWSMCMVCEVCVWCVKSVFGVWSLCMVCEVCVWCVSNAFRVLSVCDLTDPVSSLSSRVVVGVHSTLIPHSPFNSPSPLNSHSGDIYMGLEYWTCLLGEKVRREDRVSGEPPQFMQAFVLGQLWFKHTRFR